MRVRYSSYEDSPPSYEEPHSSYEGYLPLILGVHVDFLLLIVGGTILKLSVGWEDEVVTPMISMSVLNWVGLVWGLGLGIGELRTKGLGRGLDNW